MYIHVHIIYMYHAFARGCESVYLNLPGYPDVIAVGHEYGGPALGS